METVQNHVSDISQYFMRGNCYSSQYLSSKCWTYLHQQPAKWRVCAKWIPHTERWPKSRVSFSCHHPSAALQKGRQCIPQPHFNGWRVMDSFIRPSVEMRECWMVHPNVTKEKHCEVQSGSSAEMCLCLTIPRQLIWWSMANIAAQSCRIRRGQQFTTNNQNCCSVVSFFSSTM
jgi:hypothetical protein